MNVDSKGYSVTEEGSGGLRERVGELRGVGRRQGDVGVGWRGMCAEMREKRRLGRMCDGEGGRSGKRD